MTESPSHNQSLEFFVDYLKKLNENRKNESFCDLTIRCKDNRELKAHKFMLSLASNYFKDMFTSGLKESSADCIELRNINSDMLEVLLSFMYQGEFNATTAEEIENIIEYAYYFQITKLVKICEEFLKNFINENNCLKYWRIGNKLFLKNLESACITYILLSSGTDRKLFTSLLMNFTVNEMKTLLADKRLKGSDEEIFECILIWAENGLVVDSNGTKIEFLKIFSELVDNIRAFPLIKMPSFIVKALTNHNLINDKKLLQKISESNLKDDNFKKNIHKIGLYEKRLVAVCGGKIIGISSKGTPLWTIKNNYCNAKEPGFACTTFGENCLLLCGGMEGSSTSGHATNSCEYFSTITKEWKQLPNMLHATRNHACTSIDTKIYVCGHNETNNSSTLQILDLACAKWKYGPKWLNHREHFGLVSLNYALYAVGGCITSNSSPTGSKYIEFWDTRTPGRWTTCGDDTSERFSEVKCTSFGSDIYFFSNNIGYIFDTRVNKHRIWIWNANIKKSTPWKLLDACELNGDIGIVNAYKNSSYFFQYNYKGESTIYEEKQLYKYNSKNVKKSETALVALYIA